MTYDEEDMKRIQSSSSSSYCSTLWNNNIIIIMFCFLFMTLQQPKVIQSFTIHSTTAYLSKQGVELSLPSSTSLFVTQIDNNKNIETSIQNENENNSNDLKYWNIGPTFYNPNPTSPSSKLKSALSTNTHPIEDENELGKGVFLNIDWRKAWYTYPTTTSTKDETSTSAAGCDDDITIDDNTGYTEYTIDNIDGVVPNDLVGVLYRNGPGKFGVDGERVKHVLDADGLVLQITFPNNKNVEKDKEREFIFRSRFVQTKGLIEETNAKRFIYRGTFGTGPWSTLLSTPPKNGINADSWLDQQSIPCKVLSNAFNTNIKNTANTQIISFGGKLLALFEAGLPYELNPKTLETIGEFDMGGVLTKDKLPVKLGMEDAIPEQFMPSIIGGAAHTAHPNVCPDSGNLVGWHWSQIVVDKSLEVTFTEWSKEDFSPIAKSTFKVTNCELAPHDMALTKNYILLKVNALTMNQLPFLMGLKGPAASLEMDGQANVFVHVFPRPTAKEQFEPFVVEVPPCFSIHFSHAYEDEESGNIVSFFSGWPPSDSKDFLGAWGGFAPNFAVIPPTYYWKMVIDPRERKCVHLDVAPGSVNACAEHPLVHPNFTTTKAKYAYAVVSNLVGDASAPCGYAKLLVEDGDERKRKIGEINEDIDAYFFGTRFFAGEPLIVPKHEGDINNEEAAYLLGMIFDAVKDRAGVAIFDLERNLNEGPIATMWLKSSVPHGLHGCFAADQNGSSSVFC